MTASQSFARRIDCESIVAEATIGGAINGELIVTGAIVGGAIVGEAIVGGDGAVLAQQGGNQKRIAGACSGRDELGGQHDDLEEIAGVCSGSDELRRWSPQ